MASFVVASSSSTSANTTTTKKFSCSEPGCQHSYTAKSSLDEHVQSAHLGRSFSCEWCSQETNDSSNHRRHQKSCKNRPDGLTDTVHHCPFLGCDVYNRRADNIKRHMAKCQSRGASSGVRPVKVPLQDLQAGRIDIRALQVGDGEGSVVPPSPRGRGARRQARRGPGARQVLLGQGQEREREAEKVEEETRPAQAGEEGEAEVEGEGEVEDVELLLLQIASQQRQEQLLREVHQQEQHQQKQQQQLPGLVEWWEIPGMMEDLPQGGDIFPDFNFEEPDWTLGGHLGFPVFWSANEAAEPSGVEVVEEQEQVEPLPPTALGMETGEAIGALDTLEGLEGWGLAPLEAFGALDSGVPPFSHVSLQDLELQTTSWLLERDSENESS